MDKLKVALVAASMANQSKEGILLYSKYQKDLEVLAKNLDFDLSIYKEILKTAGEVSAARKEIDSKNIDFVILFHPNYIIGDLVFELMKTKAYLGLWAIEESTKSGPLPFASFVNLNQNTSIAGHFFRDNEKKFKWFFGSVDSKYFKQRFEITIRSLSAIKKLKDSKVAQIGKIADGFRGMYYDEMEIYKNLGVDVVRGVEIEDVMARGEKIDKKLVKEVMDKIYSNCAKITVTEDKILDSAKLYLATKEICEENNFKAVAFSCWPKLADFKNLRSCLVNSLLGLDGIPSSCEGDMLSAISMLILKEISGKAAAVMDFPAFDEEDESILLWHCGSAPFEMANNCGVSCNHHYCAEFAEEKEFVNLGPITDMVFPVSDITVFRLTKRCDSFYYFTGKTFDEKKESWDGSRGWVGDLKLYGKPIKVIDLVNTILLNSLQHHFPIVLKDVSACLEEFAYWLDLKRINNIEYKDYLYVR
ncbi:MAG: hypothetical protein WCJ54_00805 [Actinomycetota bacterium]